ncbi:MAG: prefoldin subunit [Nanoarchaeota archaeon]|nr:prefoldin subunit [Nanoarchaeota archaeon]
MEEDVPKNEGQAQNPTNPLANLDEETQGKIQEMQMLEQTFQQLLMQKNAFSMESNETELIIKEVEKSKGEISRIIGSQVVIRSTKEKILEEMKTKKELIKTRSIAIDKQEKELSEKLDSLREEIMAKIQA